MFDFVNIEIEKIERSKKNSKTIVNIYPDFSVEKHKDLMIKGKSFYAVWNENTGLWSRNELDVQEIVDNEILSIASEYKGNEDYKVKTKLLRNFSSNKWAEFQKYCKSLPDTYHELDERILFQNDKIKKKDYVSKFLDYPLKKGSMENYEELISTLYDPEEREKIEWAIGSIIEGDSKWIQKFLVFYGKPGSGKSTVLNLIQKLFDGYWTSFDAKALGSRNNQFALEAFRDHPLLAIQHDGDLSRLEDNTVINSIVSHETMRVNEKFKATYESKFQTMLFLGTNKPVKITDAKSGILRRLIYVAPSGRTVPIKRYNEIIKSLDFELGAIAYHCRRVYKRLGPSFYDNYIAKEMIIETNDFYNFIDDNFDFFTLDNPEWVTLKMVWVKYREYCEEARVPYPYSMKVVKTELMNYYREFYDRYNGNRSVYIGFKEDMFEYIPLKKDSDTQNDSGWLEFNETQSFFDLVFQNEKAQYANTEDKPTCSWDRCKTKLKDIETSKLHYVLIPEEYNLICIDFDLKNEEGEKDYDLNVIAANDFPRTYAELSKSGGGIHLYYYYSGDTSSLSSIFDTDIEIKVMKGKSSIRRLVSKCNDIKIATISSGLPKKENKKMLSEEVVKSEKGLRDLIKRNLRKEIHGNTTQSINFIHKILEDAYESALKYDVTDMRNDIQVFALNSTNQAEHCLKMVSSMKFKSEEPSDSVSGDSEIPIVFFDIEIFPNLFIVCWKKKGEGIGVSWINPSSSDIEKLTKFRLVGYNNRRYDNHILYARMIGYSIEGLYNLSQRIINDNDRNAMFGEAYNLSYTDVYDFLAANNKKGLKKWEIELGINHQEFPYRWDEPVPEDKWNEAVEYCANDVIATEKVWEANQADWLAREILADLSGLTVNDTTNACTTKIIVGNDKNPQNKFVYTDLSTIFPGYKYNKFGIDKSEYNEGVKIVSGKSIYRGEDPGEGGYVYSEPGMYPNVAVLDVASMHPHSLMTLNYFGDEYTKRFADIVEARILIKHGEYDKARELMDGKLSKYLDDPSEAKKLAGALKTAINSVYGLTSASFPNKLRDPRNVDNIIAKYGALFMINLKHEVMKRGYKVINIKTDSIKIANADSQIIDFVMDYGKKYGYDFEHESTYSKICLVNDAVSIARYASKNYCKDKYGYIPEKNVNKELKWDATGAQFQVPYVFKTLFSEEPIEFSDLCETKSVSSAMYLDMNENLSDLPFDQNGNSTPDDRPSRHDYHFIGKVGSFCPIKPGEGGGILLREAADKNGNIKYDSVNGTKDYRWMESEMVKKLGKENSIDLNHYEELVNDALETISKYGDPERFRSNDQNEDVNWLNIPEEVDEESMFDDFPMNKPEC